MAYRTEIEKLEQRYAENPKQWFAALADAYRKQGDVDLAIEYVKSGIEERPDYASAHIVLGRCYLDKNMDDEAARSFEEVLELDAENIIALKSLAEIAERKSDPGGARHWINRLLEVDPMNEEAHECLVRLESAEPAAQPEPEVEVPEMPVSPMQEESPPVESRVESLPDAPPATGTEYPSETFSEAPQAPMEPAAIEPIELEQGETGAEYPIEPIELETTEADASSLLAGIPEEDDTAPQDFDTASSIEPIELESADLGADSLLAGLPAEEESMFDDEEPSSPIEPIELESAELGADSLLASLSTQTEPTYEDVTAPIEAPEFGFRDTESAPPPSESEPLQADVSDVEDTLPHSEVPQGEDFSLPSEESESEVLRSEELAAAVEPSEPERLDEGEGVLIEEGASEIEAPEVDWDIEPALEKDSKRLSVPPTTEVEAADLEAMRMADEAAAGPELDDVAADVQQTESPATAQIDASELDRLREEDALQAKTPAEEMPETGMPAVEMPETGMPEVETPDQEMPREEAPEAETFETVDLAASAESFDMEIPEGEDLGVIPFDEDLGWGTAEGESDSVFLEGRYEESSVQDAGAQNEPESLQFEEEPAEVPAGGPAAEVDTEAFHEMDGDDDSTALPLIMPEDSAEGEAATQAEPEPVVTETMAEVYANQGLLDQAREIYEVLVMQHSNDARLRGRLEELTVQVENAAQATRQSRFSVRATGGDSAVDFLRNIFSHYAVPAHPEWDAATPEQGVEATADQLAMETVVEEPEQETTAELPAIETVGESSEIETATEEREPANETVGEAPTQTPDPEPTPLDEAFSEDVSDALGEPTVPASDEVSLESVFDGGAPHSGPPPAGGTDSTIEPAEQGVSFDEFYGTDASESSPKTDRTSEDDEPTDDDDFKRWLEGLKT